jgi:hypothetical protein
MLLGLALVLITWMALTPQPVELPEAPLADKWGHFVAFLGLAFLVDASWPARGFDLPKWAPLLGYGLAIELIQSQIPNRNLSLGDFVADAAGVAAYALLLAICNFRSE